MKIGFIGYGNMATAIVHGLLQAKMLSPGDIHIYDLNEDKCNSAKKESLQVDKTLVSLLDAVDTVFLCVKPNNFTQILNDLSTYNEISKKQLVSIAAGISISFINDIVGENVPVIRTMPNTPLLLGKGTTAICYNEAVTNESLAFVKSCFAAAGTVYELPEEQFDHVINLNGSSPAYIYLVAKIVSEFASEQGGIPYDTAMSMFCDTLVGSSYMLKNSGKTADELISAVSSPGGTTVAALNAFNANGLTEALQAGLKACVERSREMSSKE